MAFNEPANPKVAYLASQGRMDPASLTLDDVSNFTIAPDASVPVLIVEPNSPRPNQSLYLSRALSIGDRPSFRVDVKSVGSLTPRDLDGRSLVVLDEVAPPLPTGAVGQQLKAILDEGGGIVFVPGPERSETWAQAWRAMLPATIGPVVDRTSDAGGTLSSIDYASPVFELFNAPRSGDFTTARFYRYRALTPSPGALISARFDDGSPALVERAVGSGRVVIWSSTIDSYWTNLPLQPVFLPFVHQFGKHVGRYIDPRPSFVTGEVLDLSRHGELTAPFLGGRAADSLTELTLESPSGVKQRVTATGPNHLVTLHERGFYELRGRDTPVGSGRPIAVNIDASESDLSHLDPLDLVAAVTSASAQQQAGSDFNAATPQDQERRQRLWWYLLLVAVLVLAGETAVSNRLSRATS